MVGGIDGGLAANGSVECFMKRGKDEIGQEVGRKVVSDVGRSRRESHAEGGS